jgi:hypothetical protein
MDIITNEVIKILNDFGMKGEKAAQAMNVTYGTFRNKKNLNNSTDYFQ